MAERTAPTWTWRPFSCEQYQEFSRSLIHFSQKLTNSNASPAGVRLSPEQSLDLPYVCGRTMLEHGYTIGTDYVAIRSAWFPTMLKQIMAFERGDASPPSDDEAEWIREMMREVNTTGLDVAVDSISIRARQLLVEKDGTYVAVTPLGSAGLCEILDGRINAHNEEQSASKRKTLKRAYMGYGGSNPQNIGGRARAAQRPLVFFAPSGGHHPREALRYYHRGISLVPNKEKMRNYHAWHIAQRASSGGELLSNSNRRAQEEALIKSIAQDILSRAEHAYGALIAHRERLPHQGNPLVSPQVPATVCGLIDPSLRDGDWAYRTAWAISETISDYRTAGRQRLLDFDITSSETLAQWIEEVLV
ncbi:hypothetical protein [Thiorhodovibrio frisius]|uniref:Uncharacterized protein n=1 Tax=Thiorhodovibrio frisius TaxID=631362 RepID=H8Z7X2_9GAMM|nr:hypothetical protein [Thiorhodovibrio frisius]EIC20984.1 hypothetical protein Thi970DRAFT_04666 [Thiorhodovibrio frisius]WPL22040.1 hypothetical protein Thiofri_02191 [Thiorhodovibrio frisius]